MKNYDNIKPFS